jgi:hypothetical protein
MPLLRMPRDETELQTAERHVTDGEQLVACQRELIRRLSERDLPTEKAERVLVRLESLLANARDHLNRLLNSE